MREPDPAPPRFSAPRPTAWLWQLAILVALLTALFVALIARDLPDPSAANLIRRLVAIALLIIGVCVISATAHRWLKR